MAGARDTVRAQLAQERADVREELRQARVQEQEGTGELQAKRDLQARRAEQAQRNEAATAEAKAAGGPAENKALTPNAENKNGDGLDDVAFTSASVRQAARDAGLTGDSFKRKRKSSDRGFTAADVERIAANSADEEE